MQECFQRTALLLGEEALDRLADAHICVIGLGGVGSYVAEALARSGVGHLTLVDDDTVNLTNCNRQLCALHSTVGRPKAEVVAERVRDINPECRVTPLHLRYTGSELQLTDYDYIADAIDSLADKLMLIENAAKSAVPILACMGTGNKLDATQLRIADIDKTCGCPLAKRVRLALRQRGVSKLQVVFSPELPKKPDPTEKTIGSVPWVPSAAGLLMAATIVQNLLADRMVIPKYKTKEKDEGDSHEHEHLSAHL